MSYQWPVQLSAVAFGLDANTGSFLKSAIAGELCYTIDKKQLYLVTSSASGSDASLLPILTGTTVLGTTDNVSNNSTVIGTTTTDALNNLKTYISNISGSYGLIVSSSIIGNQSIISGSTVTDALNTTKPIYTQVKGNSGQGPGSFTLVHPTVDINPGTYYNTSTGQYTVPYNGILFLSGVITFGSQPPGCYIKFYLNGNYITEMSNPSNIENSYRYNFHYKVSAGDVVTVAVSVNTYAISSGDNNKLNLTLLRT